jgi:zeta-carotene desaturase
MPTRPRTALIIGGGIAGMACALRLAEHAVKPTILETRKKLGGRATSFKDVRSGAWLDNCQHVVLGCCTNYLDFLHRLGARDKIVWHTTQHWIEAGGRRSEISRGLLPAPAHFTTSFLKSSFLSLAEKTQIARALSRIMRVDRAEFASRTFADFLRSSSQSDRVIRVFWEPVIVSACNMTCERVSAAVALHVFQEGFLAAPSAADIGVPGVPLLDLYARAEDLLTSAGGQVLLGESVAHVDESSATTADGTRHEADTVICAVPVERANTIVDERIRATDPRFTPLDRFTHSPILGVHLTFDRCVLPRNAGNAIIPHCVLVDRATQWIFRKDADGKSLHAVISAADAWVPLTEAEIGEKVLADLHACIPLSREAKLLSVRAVKEKLATFAPFPGVEKLRPNAAGPSGLVLAGDYTDTGWPATMEGAARSGYSAAAAALGIDESSLLIPPLPIAPLAGILGLRPARANVA